MDITDDLTLTGLDLPGSFIEISANTLQDRIFDVKPGVNFNLSHVTLAHANVGLSDGGGIKSRQAAITLYNVFVYSNQAASGAGLFAVDSDVNIKASRFSHNMASDRGGGVYLQNSTLVMDDTVVQQNDAAIGGGPSMALWMIIQPQPYRLRIHSSALMTLRLQVAALICHLVLAAQWKIRQSFYLGLLSKVMMPFGEQEFFILPVI